MVEVFEIKKPGLVVHLDWTHFDSDVWWMPNINKPFKQMDLAAVPDTAPNMAFMELCWVFSISLFCVLLETLQTVHKRIQIWRYQGYTNQAAMVVER